MARAWCRAAVVVAAGAVAGGCSLSFPVPGLKTDDLATGSIDRKAAILSPALDGEDLRRANAALAVTLDPQGNGERAAWHNPASGNKGSFTALGPPFPDRDRVCRKFEGEVSVVAAPSRHVEGSACRETSGEWALEASPVVRS